MLISEYLCLHGAVAVTILEVLGPWSYPIYHLAVVPQEWGEAIEAERLNYIQRMPCEKGYSKKRVQ